jgi:NTE family protein
MTSLGQTPTAARVALVLGGGAAHGAYEVGVLRYLHEALPRELGIAPRLDILSGTSAGAINTCALAAYAHDPAQGVRRLVELWQSLDLSEFVRVDRRALTRLVRSLARGRAPDAASAAHAFLSAAPLRRLLERHLPFERIEDNLRAHHLDAATVTATHVATGTCEVFVAARAGFEPWAHEPGLRARPVALDLRHVLASAAVPLVFPAVAIDGALYCDGGLRQLVPLAPACRMGADALLVVNPSAGSDQRSAVLEHERELHHGSPAYLAGKALDALLLDRLDDDLARVRQMNRLLGVGTRLVGPGFLDAVNAGVPPAHALRPREVVEVRPSTPLALLCADYVRSPAFRRRRCHAVEWMARWMAALEGGREATLLSYMLFDGEFAAQLVDLGFRDAQAMSGALARLFTPRLVREGAA